MHARNQARIKERKAEAMDRKADGADKHGELLRSNRETILERIAGYIKHIDGCANLEMRDCDLCSEIKIFI